MIYFSPKCLHYIALVKTGHILPPHTNELALRRNLLRRASIANVHWLLQHGMSLYILDYHNTFFAVMVFCKIASVLSVVTCKFVISLLLFLCFFLHSLFTCMYPFIANPFLFLSFFFLFFFLF